MFSDVTGAFYIAHKPDFTRLHIDLYYNTTKMINKMQTPVETPSLFRKKTVKNDKKDF